MGSQNARLLYITVDAHLKTILFYFGDLNFHSDTMDIYYISIHYQYIVNKQKWAHCIALEKFSYNKSKDPHFHTIWHFSDEG